MANNGRKGRSLAALGSAVNPVPFEVQREELEDGIRAFTVRGELDMNTAPELENSLEEGTTGESAQVVLDLTECEFIDSTGIALIVRSWQRLDRGGDGGRRRPPRALLRQSPGRRLLRDHRGRDLDLRARAARRGPRRAARWRPPQARRTT